MWRLLSKLILLCYQLINKGTKIQSYCGVEVSYFSWCCSIPVYFDRLWMESPGREPVRRIIWLELQWHLQVSGEDGRGSRALWGRWWSCLGCKFLNLQFYPFIVSSAVVIYTVVKLYWASPPPNFHMLKWVMCGSVITVMSWILQFFFIEKFTNRSQWLWALYSRCDHFLKKRQWILGNDVWQY